MVVPVRVTRSLWEDGMARRPVDVDDSRCHQLLTWWRAAQRGRPWPARSDFDPVLFPGLLPHIFLCDVASAPKLHFVYRLTGTEIDHVLGVNGAGRQLTEVPIHDDVNSHWEQFHQTLDSSEPTYLEHDFLTPDRRAVAYRRLLLPLSRTGPNVDLLLGLLVFTKAWERVDDDVL